MDSAWPRIAGGCPKPHSVPVSAYPSSPRARHAVRTRFCVPLACSQRAEVALTECDRQRPGSSARPSEIPWRDCRDHPFGVRKRTRFCVPCKQTFTGPMARWRRRLGWACGRVRVGSYQSMRLGVSHPLRAGQTAPNALNYRRGKEGRGKAPLLDSGACGRMPEITESLRRRPPVWGQRRTDRQTRRRQSHQPGACGEHARHADKYSKTDKW